MDESPNQSESTTPTGSTTPNGTLNVKPALRKNPAHPAGGIPAAAPSDPVPKISKEHIKWDEVIIEEHDKLRGTRQKIDEPKTPFNYDSGAESDGSHAKAPQNPRKTLNFAQLEEKLVDVAANYLPSPTSSFGDHSDDEGKRKAFEENRKKHYNEMELVRKFRMEHANGEDDGDEGNEADDDMDS